MEHKVNNRYKLLIFIPLILGILIDNISFISKLYADVFWVISIIFIVLWFWTGRLFARLSENKRKGFYLGNSLWLVSYVIFRLWLYVPIPNLRNTITIFLENFGRYYVIGIAPIVINILKFINVSFLANTGAGVLSVAYIFMVIVFSVGFCYELYWKRDKKKLIIITTFLVIFSLPVINFLDPFQQGVKDSRIVVKETSTEIKSTYSDYSKIGIKILFYFYLKEGKVDWKITNPKGEIIYAGYEVVEDGKIYSQLTYPNNYLNGFISKKTEVSTGNPNIFGIKPPNILGKYTLTIKSYKATGKLDIYWQDRPEPAY